MVITGPTQRVTYGGRGCDTWLRELVGNYPALATYKLWDLGAATEAS